MVQYSRIDDENRKNYELLGKVVLDVMNYTTPEKEGISSVNIKTYIDVLEEHQLSTHNMIMLRGNNIFFEKYWEPFYPEFLHRMYSITKSVVLLAIGFAEQDGLLELDDPIVKYFEKEAKESEQVDENVRKQTIRHMLMMSTAKSPSGWFSNAKGDRVRCYFENENPSREPGMRFEYDTCSSFVLCALVERLTGMSFMDYMREKLFDKIGVSKEAYCLKCPGGHSWGDSALICQPRDLLLIARFVMNKGIWDGEQILNEEYITATTSKQIENWEEGTVKDLKSYGYGYQIWRTYDNSYMFYGMGCQFAVCVPDKDIIFIYNGDNQGHEGAEDLVVRSFFEIVMRNAQDIPLAPNPEAEEHLQQPMKLMVARGEAHCELQDKINGAVFKMQPNRMNFTEISLHFSEDCCYFNYINAQGEKSLPFGMLKNVFDYFPQEGYSDQVGSEWTKGHYYRCATSAAWLSEKKLHIKVQVIDKYFGRMDIILDFADENKVEMNITKTAEYFLDEYPGCAVGTR